MLRWLASGTQASRITWSGLTSDSADAVIAAQVRYFAPRGTQVEWKLYDCDQPADLAQRLLAAGAAELRWLVVFRYDGCWSGWAAGQSSKTTPTGSRSHFIP